MNREQQSDATSDRDRRGSAADVIRYRSRTTVSAMGILQQLIRLHGPRDILLLRRGCRWTGQHDDEAVSCDCDGMVASYCFMVPSSNQRFLRQQARPWHSGMGRLFGCNLRAATLRDSERRSVVW